MSATMDDATLVKASLKKQRDMQDELIARLERYQAPVDTTELKRLVTEFKAALNSAASLKPRIDTSTVELTISNAVNTALATTSLSKLANAVDDQTRAVERSNSLLLNGTGWRLKWWVILVTLALGFLAGWAVNWYFEIPAEITGNAKNERLLNDYRKGLDEGDNLVKFVNSSCKLKKQFAVFNKQSITCDATLASPLRFVPK